MSEKNNLLIVRMDKIGDLVLSLPVDHAPVCAIHNVTWLISKGTGFIAQNATPPRRFFEMEKQFSLQNLSQLIKWMRSGNFSSAVVLYAPWWIGLALLLAGVKNRVGRLSRWHSYVFFNHGVRQSRKHGDRHETDDNLSLLQAGLDAKIPLVAEVPPLTLNPPPTRLEQWQLSNKNYFVVHPGMAGSSLNWPTVMYAELIQKLTDSAMVVVTGTKADAEYLTPLRNLLQQSNVRDKVIWLNEKLNTEQLLSVLKGARSVIAPSTGVLHLAASVGAPSVGLYSPVPVQRPTRWGARGPNVNLLTSPASPEQARLDPEAAMAQIKVSEVLQAAGVHS